MNTEKKTSAQGVFTALITPFKKSGEIDQPRFESLLKRQLEAGIHGVIPCGTTGETPTLTREEKQSLILTCINLCQGTSTKVYAGTGTNNTQETVELSKWASEKGAQGVLIVTPYYNKPTQAGLKAHYTAVADSLNGNCDLMIYNVPGRTSVSLTPDTLSELSKHAKIGSLKEATGSMTFLSDIVDQLKNSHTSLSIFSGDDPTYFSSLGLGAKGIVSVASNVIPKEMVTFQKAPTQEQHEKWFPLFRDLFVETNPAPTKYALSLLGLCEPTLRLPLVEMSEKSKTTVRDTLKKVGVL